jgi:cytochrome c oxidase assembly protein subunit 15
MDRGIAENSLKDAHTAAAHRCAIGIWLWTVAALIFVTVLVGGATRLTGSGLSIVQWQPVTGIVPPLSDAAWQSVFAQYQTIPQFRDINFGMSLDAFKTIYWWEWSHRMLGRLVGAAFLGPFLFFLWRGWIGPGLRARLWAIFGLGALQGAIGWWMVTSGLAQRVSVAHERLAVHLTLACIIFAAVVWTAQGLRAFEQVAVPTRLRASAIGLLVLVLAQIFIGALVAGLHGGLIHNTWPLIDGAFIPSSERLMFHTPSWSNFFDNVLTVQFEHRMLAYLLWILAVVHLVDAASQAKNSALNGALALACAVTIQAGIGILTLLHGAPALLALLHQGMAVVVLGVAVMHVGRLATRQRPVGNTAVPLPSRS